VLIPSRLRFVRRVRHQVGWQIEVPLGDPHQIRLGEHVRYSVPVEDLQRHAVPLARMFLQAVPGGHRDLLYREERDRVYFAAFPADRVQVPPNLFLQAVLLHRAGHHQRLGRCTADEPCRAG